MYLAFAATTSQYAFSLENKSPEMTKQLLDVVKKKLHMAANIAIFDNILYRPYCLLPTSETPHPVI